jgi:signal transduction histidine kinase
MPRKPPPPRRSMFLRLVFLFAALATVPLAITGLVMSRNSQSRVLETGREMSRLGEAAMNNSLNRVINLSKENSEKSSSRLIDMGTKALNTAKQRQTEVGQKALRESGERLRETSAGTLKQSGGQLAGRAQEVLRESNDRLQKVQREALVPIKNAVVSNVRDILEDRDRQLVALTRDSLRQSAQMTNLEQARRLATAADTTIDKLVSALDQATNIQAVRFYRVAEAPEALQHIAESRVPDAQRAALFTPGGDLVADFPANAAAEAGWTRPETLREFLRVANNNRPFTGDINMTADGPSLVLGVPVRAGARFGVLVTDCLLKDLSKSVTAPAERQTNVAIANRNGRVLLSGGGAPPATSPEQSSTILGALRRGEETTVESIGAGGEATLAAVVPLKNVNALVLVQQPLRAALTKADDLERRLAEQSKNDARALERLVVRIGTAQVDAVAPEQERIARQAARVMQRQTTQVVSASIAALRWKEKASTETAAIRIAQEAERATAGLAESMKASGLQAAEAASEKLEQEAKKNIRGVVLTTRMNAENASLRSARDVQNSSFTLMGVFFVAACLLGVLTARSIIRPVQQLASATQEFAAGNYHYRLHTTSRDEIGQLAAGFNEMAAAVQATNRRLEEEKRRIQTIVESSPDGLIMIEPDGSVGFLNPASRRMLGLPEAPDVPVQQVVETDEEAARRIAPVLAPAETNGHAPVEVAIEGPAPRVLQLRTVEVPSGDGTTARLQHLHDITREREIDQMKSDFVSLVSHELRTPLTSILGFSSYMLTNKLGDLTEMQRTAAESIHRQAKRLSAIISDFLDISRIESGAIQMARDRLNLPEITQRVVQDLRPQAAEKNLEIVVEMPTGLTALGDEHRVSQVLTNLLGNAVKFTDRGRVTVRAAQVDGQIRMAVHDTGVGIPPDELDKVFDRFYQVEKVVSRKTGGTGLGLAITKNIVEAHGGRIWIESAPGAGTTAHVTLPAPSEGAEPAAAVGEAPAPTLAVA